MLSIFDCLLKVYTIKAKEFGSYVHSCLFLQGSAAAELLGCGGKYYSMLGRSVHSTEKIIKFGQYANYQSYGKKLQGFH